MTRDLPHVSRETGAAYAEAELLFTPDGWDQVRRYVELLASAGVERGLIGPREVPRLWERHVVNCALVAGVIPPGASVADLGSGAGLPGVVLALARADLTVELVEPLQRRTDFLSEVVTDLGLDGRVHVRRARAEDLHGERTFDVVTARAVAPLSRLLGWAMPLVAPTGELVALKGAGAAAEVTEAAAVLRRLRCDRPRIETVAGPEGLSTATLVRVAHAGTPRVS